MEEVLDFTFLFSNTGIYICTFSSKDFFCKKYKKHIVLAYKQIKTRYNVIIKTKNDVFDDKIFTSFFQ